MPECPHLLGPKMMGKDDQGEHAIESQSYIPDLPGRAIKSSNFFFISPVFSRAILLIKQVTFHHSRHLHSVNVDEVSTGLLLDKCCPGNGEKMQMQ